MIDAQINVTEAANSVLEQEQRNREALRYLLDFYLDKGNGLLAEKTYMGGTEAYIASVTLQWVSEKVGFASELGLLRDKTDEQSNQVPIDSSTINLIQQRPIDWSRQAPLAQYLAARKNHKFPPILAVISSPWVDNPEADEWDSQGRAIRSSVEFTPLDSKSRVGLITLTENVEIFALDGQHRVMAIRGLLELIRTGYLSRKRKDGNPEKGSPIRLDDLASQLSISRSYIQGLSGERIGIEFISSVVAGETREEARRRVRSIFVHVNRMAAPLTTGQLDQLNEDEGFSIVARRVATEHPLLAKGENRVEWSAPSISERSSALTTLKTLHEMVEGYLGPDLNIAVGYHQKGLIPLRPEDDQLDNGFTEFSNFWNLLSTLPSYKKLEQGADTSEMRRFSHEKKKDDTKLAEGHMLFRPVGQTALASAVGTLIAARGQDLNNLFEKLRKYDSEGGFRLDTPSSLWYMVLYDPNKKRMSIRGASLAKRLLEYLLGGGIPEESERQKLREELAEARTIHTGGSDDPSLDTHEGEAINFDGRWVNPETIELPPVIRL